MMFWSEFRPKLLYMGVGFKFGIGFSKLVTVLYEFRNKISENHRVQTLLLIIRMNTHQVQVNYVVLFDGVKQMYETKREQTSFTFLKCLA